MECQIELKLGKAESFGPMKMLKKSHTNWPSQNSTCFTKHSSGRNLRKILEGKRLNEMCPNLVEIGYMSRRRPGKIISHNGAR